MTNFKPRMIGVTGILLMAAGGALMAVGIAKLQEDILKVA